MCGVLFLGEGPIHEPGSCSCARHPLICETPIHEPGSFSSKTYLQGKRLKKSGMMSQKRPEFEAMAGKS